MRSSKDIRDELDALDRQITRALSNVRTLERVEGELEKELEEVLSAEALASDLPPKCGQIWKDASGVRYLIVQRVDMGWPSFTGISSSGKWIDFNPTWTYAGNCTGFTGETE